MPNLIVCGRDIVNTASTESEYTIYGSPIDKASINTGLEGLLKGLLIGCYRYISLSK
jgi:hypothetical protein